MRYKLDTNFTMLEACSLLRIQPPAVEASNMTCNSAPTAHDTEKSKKKKEKRKRKKGGTFRMLEPPTLDERGSTSAPRTKPGAPQNLLLAPMKALLAGDRLL